MGLKDLLSGINPIDTISNLFKTGYSIYQDQRDFNYQKNLQKQLFTRDDNAIQRRMADYQKAGINPLMALGSSGASVSNAGVLNSGDISVDSNFFSNQQQKKLERDTIKQEMQQRKLSMEQMKIQLRAGKIANWNAMQDLNTKRLEQSILKKQIEQMETSGIYPLSGLGKTWSDVAGLFIPALNAQFERWSRNPIIQKLVESPLAQSGTPDLIEPLKGKIIEKAQQVADKLGQPVVQTKEKPSSYITEYEARVLRGANDKSVYATHYQKKSKTTRGRFYTEKKVLPNKF